MTFHNQVTTNGVTHSVLSQHTNPVDFAQVSALELREWVTKTALEAIAGMNRLDMIEAMLSNKILLASEDATANESVNVGVPAINENSQTDAEQADTALEVSQYGQDTVSQIDRAYKWLCDVEQLPYFGKPGRHHDLLHARYLKAYSKTNPELAPYHAHNESTFMINHIHFTQDRFRGLYILLNTKESTLQSSTQRPSAPPDNAIAARPVQYIKPGVKIVSGTVNVQSTVEAVAQKPQPTAALDLVGVLLNGIDLQSIPDPQTCSIGKLEQAKPQGTARRGGYGGQGFRIMSRGNAIVRVPVRDNGSGNGHLKQHISDSYTSQTDSRNGKRTRPLTYDRGGSPAKRGRTS